jgi:filamentous hemagglutinin family protein
MYQRPHLFRLRTVALLTLFAHSLLGGVVLDGSFGAKGALPGPNFMITANMGKLVNTNLFQSFNQFNVNSTESATFSGPSTVHNILARVTNGSPSSIDGAVNSSIQGANLFFLNPAGVVFGKDAKINVSGSFAVSTANYLKLADGGKFNTSLGGGDVLTSAPVTAFGFLKAPAGVSIAGSNTVNELGFVVPGLGLTVAPQKSFSIVAGDIAMNANTISGSGSRVNLVSVKSAGEVQLDATAINSTVDVSQFTVLGSINLTKGALINTTGPGGGPVFVRGANLLLDNSEIVANTIGDLPGGGIDIATTASVEVVNFSIVTTDAGDPFLPGSFGNGPGGNLSIRTASLLVDVGLDQTNLFGLQARTFTNGDGGNVTIQAHDIVLITGDISTTASSGSSTTTGNAGTITITADSLVMGPSPDPDFFIVPAIASQTAGAGHAGNVTINLTGPLVMHDAVIVTGAGFESSGNAGNITITANSISLGHESFFGGSSISANSNGTGDAGTILMSAFGDVMLDNSFVGARPLAGTSGNGGSITINATNLSLTNGAVIDAISGAGSGGLIFLFATGSILVDESFIEASTFGFGAGKNIFIAASNLVVGDGSEIAAVTTGAGKAGDITITVAGNITLGGTLSSGTISTSTYSSGKGGNIFINAQTLTIDGVNAPPNTTGILSLAAATGDAGTIKVDVSDLFMSNGAFISAATLGQGNAGGVSVTASSLTVAGGGEISSSTSGDGNGGNVNVTAGSLLIDGTVSFLQTGIFATTGNLDFGGGGIGSAGNIAVQAGDLKIINGGKISSSTFGEGNGGNVNVTADSLLIEGVGELSGGGIFAETHGGGNAGGVAVQAHDLRLTNLGEISSSTDGVGNGGSVSVIADSLTSIGGLIAAYTFGDGNGGNIDVTANSLFIDGAGDSSLFVGSGIFATSIGFRGNGNAGSITVQAHDLKITNGGAISTATFSDGKGGNIMVTADSLLINGAGEINETGILAVTDGGSGHAGNIAVQAGDMKIIAGGDITSSTRLDGDGGNVTVIADSLLIDGTDSPGFLTGILANAEGSPFELTGGNAGNVIVRAGNLIITAGGEISSSTFTVGNGGSVTVIADSFLIDGAGPNLFSFPTGVFAAAERSSGRGGDVVVSAGFLSLQNGGEVSAASFTSAAAGSVNLSLGTLSMDSDSSISSANTGTGSAGRVIIKTTGPVKLADGSSISTLSTFGDAGSIDIRSGGKIKLVSDSLSNQSRITVKGGHNGGDITIKAPVLVSLINSEINATAGNIGGNITIDPIVLRLRNSTISASAGSQGGHINLFTSFLDGPVRAVTSDGRLLLAFKSSISATGGTANGTVNVTAPTLDLGAELITLPISLLSAENQLQERCTALLQGDFSSFISIGRGGTEPAPEELQTTF